VEEKRVNEKGGEPGKNSDQLISRACANEKTRTLAVKAQIPRAGFNEEGMKNSCGLIICFLNKGESNGVNCPRFSKPCF